MESAVKLPLDLMQIPPFRAMKDAMGGIERALLLWWELWRELGYWAQEGHSLGRLQGEQVQGFINSLVASGLAPDVKTCRETVFDGVLIKASKLLVPDGEDFVCQRFVVLNSDMRQRGCKERMGGSMKAFQAKQKKLAGAVMQQTLSIAGFKFVDEAGNPLDSETTKRITRLIISCDNALFKPERPNVLFTEGLIQSALTVVKRLNDEAIDHVMRNVALHRDHPFLNGMTTEKLLPQFEGVMPKLE